MDVKHVERTRAGNLILPINLVEPPRQKIHACVRGFVIAIRAVPIKPPATTYRSESHGLRIPTFKLGCLRQINVGQFIVPRRVRMNVAMCAAPDVHLVVHFIEVRDREAALKRAR